MISPRKLPVVILSLLALAALVGIVYVQADGPNRVGLVVVHGNGDVITQCVEFSEDEISGAEVLQRSGLDLSMDVAGYGATICSIDSEGCSFPAESCFCQCQGSPCEYWSYWHAANGEWDYSNLGASNYFVHNGDVEGWVWGEGVIGASADVTPPQLSFDEICAVPATNTPTVTSTPVPPVPLPTPTSTATPSPVPTPVIKFFVADRTMITAGESATLSWELSGAETVVLRYNSVVEGVVSPGSKTVAPTETTVYSLVARNKGSEAVMQVTITVNAATSTPSPTNTAPPPTDTPSSATAAITSVVPATATPGPTPSVALPTLPPPATTVSLPTSTAAVFPSPTPTAPLPTATATPQVVARVTASTQEQPSPSGQAVAPNSNASQPQSRPPSLTERIMLFGALSVVVLLFTTVPALLLIGGVVWWIWKGRQ